MSTKYKIINEYPLANGTVLLARFEAEPIRVKYHSLAGHFVVTQTTVEKGNYTAKDEANGKLNEKRAYVLSHIPTGARIHTFKTIGAAQSCAAALQNIANELGVDWLEANQWSANQRGKAHSYLRNYLSSSRADVCYTRQVAGKEFPTAVEEQNQAAA